MVQFSLNIKEPNYNASRSKGLVARTKTWTSANLYSKQKNKKKINWFLPLVDIFALVFIHLKGKQSQFHFNLQLQSFLFVPVNL